VLPVPIGLQLRNGLKSYFPGNSSNCYCSMLVTVPNNCYKIPSLLKERKRKGKIHKCDLVFYFVVLELVTDNSMLTSKSYYILIKFDYVLY
jgi:hypothetical protein